MKKYALLFLLLLCGIVCAAVWFSPLASLDITEYVNNAPVSSADGLCYPENAIVRAQAEGGEDELNAYLDSIGAVRVAAEECGGGVVIYAYSPRVCGAYYLSGGEMYNVMAMCRDGVIYLGTPILSGSY